MSRGLLLGLGRELRPWQWYKQSIILLGILFSGNVFNFRAAVNVVLTIIAFCAVAGSIYIFNDVNDLEEDRRHPEKQNRPIASGQVPVFVAVGFGAIILVGGLTLSWSVNTFVMVVVLVYILNNLFYNFILKEMLFVDVFSIAAGFVLRALAGVYAIDPTLRIPSPWLIVCVLLTALMLGFGKRLQELRLTSDEKTRSTLEVYSEELLDRLLTIVAATLLIAYSLYTFNGTTRAMMITLPFAYFATFRFFHLLLIQKNNGGVERLLLADRAFLANLILWVITVMSVIYGQSAAI